MPQICNTTLVSTNLHLKITVLLTHHLCILPGRLDLRVIECLFRSIFRLFLSHGRPCCKTESAAHCSSNEGPVSAAERGSDNRTQHRTDSRAFRLRLPAVG